MARPYVSHKKLCDNSRAAMLAAIEFYNKPQTTYREQVVTVLIVNAWELILKAALRKSGKNIFYEKRRGEAYRSISLERCLADMKKFNLWPDTVDGESVCANLSALIEYRNKTIHLYVSEDLGSILYSFLQPSIINYRDFRLAVFGKDLADDITWTLLPLAAKTPSEMVRSLRVDGDGGSSQVVAEFIGELRRIVAEAEDLGADLGRIAVVQEYNMQSGKKISRADLEVAINPDATGKVVQRKIDPNETHPFSATELIDRVNRSRKIGRKLNSHDLICMAWKYKLREDEKYVWRGKHNQTCVWSGTALSFLSNKTDEEYERVREEYKQYLQEKRQSKK